MRPEFPECSWEASFRCQGMKCMKNHFLMQGLYPVGIAGSYSAGRVVQAPFGENRTHDQSYYIMKMELAKGKKKRRCRAFESCTAHHKQKILRRKSEDFCGGELSTALEPKTSSRVTVLASSVKLKLSTTKLFYLII